MLLIDQFSLNYDQSKILTESSEPGKLIRLPKVLLQRADVPNHNRRIYPKEILMRECERYMNEAVKGRNALGELDHCQSDTINLKNVSHNIVEMHWEGDSLFGTLEILTTPSGNIVKELLKSGVKIGISSRGLGGVRRVRESMDQVEDNFKLICWDIVSNPSVPGAYLTEGAQPTSPEQKLNVLIQDFLGV